MDNNNDWSQTRDVAPSVSESFGNEYPAEDANVGKKKTHNYKERYYSSDNYGNRAEDLPLNYRQNERAGYDSGYIDLNSAVDSTQGKKKRKRIVKNVTQEPPTKTVRPLSPKVLVKKGEPRKISMTANKKPKPVVPDYPDIVFDKPMRLNRLISNAGLCSRREADAHIANGFIKINGELVTELGIKVNPTDEVTFKDKPITNQRKVYLLLNKPKGFITSLDEPKGKKVVIDLVRSACKERIYPVGRLDKMTTGVLLFTNDGDLSLKLSHPSNRMRKVYQVTLNKPLEQEALDKLTAGIELEDGPIAFDTIAYTDPEVKTIVGVELHSGKNRIVRRMFEKVGYKVTKLDRVYFAGLTRKGLKRGKWRFLSPEEVAFLKMMPT
jgi:23S rRNA pseudouridine2605 synthase